MHRVRVLSIHYSVGKYRSYDVHERTSVKTMSRQLINPISQVMSTSPPCAGSRKCPRISKDRARSSVSESVSVFRERSQRSHPRSVEEETREYAFPRTEQRPCIRLMDEGRSGKPGRWTLKLRRGVTELECLKARLSDSRCLGFFFQRQEIYGARDLVMEHRVAEGPFEIHDSDKTYYSSALANPENPAALPTPHHPISRSSRSSISHLQKSLAQSPPLHTHCPPVPHFRHPITACHTNASFDA